MISLTRVILFRVIDVFVGALDLAEMSFEGLSQRQLSTVVPSLVLLKLYIYGYLNRVQSSHLLFEPPRVVLLTCSPEAPPVLS